MISVLLGCLLAAGTQTAGYRIAGVVLNAVNGQPVAGARVTIARVEHRDQRVEFVTGPSGRFAFPGFPQGKYELIGQRRGLLTQSYGQHGELASAIVTGPGQDTEGLVLRLSPPGIVSGKVVDDAGEPAQALVELLSSAVVNGRRRLMKSSFKRTDDSGEYRFSVPAGAYYLVVSGYPWYTKFDQMMGDAAPRSMTHAGYGIKYYPDVSDHAAAEPLVLKAGQEATVNFALLPVPAATVHVHVEEDEDLTKRFTLMTGGLSGNPVIVRQGSGSGDSYNFAGIPPGHYTLRVQAGDAGRTLYGRAAVDVGATDPDVRVNLQEAPSLNGTVVLEGGGSLPESLAVVLHDEEDGHSERLPLNADGKLSIPVLAPERYRLSLEGADEYYLQSWTPEGARRDGDTLEIAEGSAVRLKLVAARGTGRLVGTVARDGRPFSGALVVLVLATGAVRPEDYRALRTDSDGSYEFRGVPPGEYTLFAVADGADLEYANPAAIRPYLASAHKIRLSPDRSHTERLELGNAPL